MLIEEYFKSIHQILDDVLKTQKENMEIAANKIFEATLEKKNIYAFGCNHAGILAQELFYRSGGLVTINPILAPGLTLDTFPVTLTSDIERLDAYGKNIIDNYCLKSGDVLIIHSVSGRNTVSVDAAMRARELGVYVIALTNMNTSRSVGSRHPSGKNLYEVSDLILDNCGSYGDAELEIEGFGQKFAPTSTAVGAVILNAIVAEVVACFVKNGVIPPVFISSNVDGGDLHNKKVLEQYKENIIYA